MVNSNTLVQGNKLIGTYSVDGHSTTNEFSTTGFKVSDKVTIGSEVSVPKINNVSRLIYSQYTPTIITNTLTETSFFASPVTILAGSLNQGDVVKCNIYGLYADAGTPSTTVNVKFGGSTLVTSTANVPNVNGTTVFKIEFVFTVLGSGPTCPIIGEGFTTIKEISSIGVPSMRALSMVNNVDINSIKDNIFDITYTWGTASTSNIITTNIITIEKY